MLWEAAPWGLLYGAAGWLLGWLGIRDRRWAWLPAGLTAALALSGVLSRLEPILRTSPSLSRTALSVLMGVALLLGISRLGALPWRVGLSTLLVPAIVLQLFTLGVLVFLVVFNIP